MKIKSAASSAALERLGTEAAYLSHPPAMSALHRLLKAFGMDVAIDLAHAVDRAARRVPPSHEPRYDAPRLITEEYGMLTDEEKQLAIVWVRQDG